MSTKFEQLLDYLVNEEMEKANELFHEIVVEKSREIYENLISEEVEDEMDEGFGADDEEMDEGSEELEDSYMMDADDDASDDDETDPKTDDETDDFLSDVDAETDDGESDEEQAMFDIKNAIADLQAAFAELETAHAEENDEFSDEEGDEFGDEEGDEFSDEEGDEEGDEETNDMMGLREYRETVGNDWEKNSQKTQGQIVGANTGEKMPGSTEGKSPISSGKGKPTTGADAKNIVAKSATSNEDGTSPKGKVGGLVKSGGEFTKGVEKNIASSSSSKMKDGAALSKQGSGYPGNNKTANAVGAGTGENSVKGATNDKSVVDHKID